MAAGLARRTTRLCGADYAHTLKESWEFAKVESRRQGFAGGAGWDFARDP
jgi:hypothetical protein